GHELDFEYYKDGNLLRLTQKGGINADGSLLADRAFVFTYMNSQVKDPVITDPTIRKNPPPDTSPQSSVIFSVQDPRGGQDSGIDETTFRYCTPEHTQPVDFLCPNLSHSNHDAKNKGKLKWRYDR